MQPRAPISRASQKEVLGLCARFARYGPPLVGIDLHMTMNLYMTIDFLDTKLLLTKNYSEINVLEKLRISRVIPLKCLYFLDISKAQNPSKITKNNSQGIIFVIISCQRVDFLAKKTLCCMHMMYQMWIKIQMQTICRRPRGPMDTGIAGSSPAEVICERCKSVLENHIVCSKPSRKFVKEFLRFSLSRPGHWEDNNSKNHEESPKESLMATSRRLIGD